MADRRLYYHKAKNLYVAIYMHAYESVYVSIRVRDEEPMLSKYDTEQKLKARALIPSQSSMCIYRKSRDTARKNCFDVFTEQRLDVLYIAKPRWPIGGKRPKYYVSQSFNVHTSAHDMGQKHNTP